MLPSHSIDLRRTASWHTAPHRGDKAAAGRGDLRRGDRASRSLLGAGGKPRPHLRSSAVLLLDGYVLYW